MPRASANSVEFPVLFADLVDVDVVVSRSKGKITSIGRKFDALDQIGSIAVDGDQLAGGGIEHDPTATG